MARRPTRTQVVALALAGIAGSLPTGCAYTAMSPLPAKYSVDKAPTCTASSGSAGLDIIWGLIWGVPSLAAFGGDEPGIGLLFAIASAVHLSSAVTGSRWGTKCRKAHKRHDAWVIDQRSLLRQQQRANTLLRNRKAEPDSNTPTTAAKPPASSPVATAAKTPAAAAKTPSNAAARTVPARRPGRVRPRNSDPWAEFWQELAR